MPLRIYPYSLVVYKWPEPFDMNIHEDFVDVMDILAGIRVKEDLDGHLSLLHMNKDSFVHHWNEINGTDMSAEEIEVAVEEWEIWKDSEIQFERIHLYQGHSK